MKVVILAGGYGTRLSEETGVRPKPMVEIGGQPILWHLMNLYGDQGFKEFVIALGYRGEVIKHYLLNAYHYQSDLSVNLATGEVSVHGRTPRDWLVHLVDTGEGTQTGGRILRLREWLRGEPFMLTYGDGLSDIDLSALLAFHRSHNRIATVTAVRALARFGGLHLDGDSVVSFKEKTHADGGWINGGFFVFNPEILDFIRDDQSVLEREPLERLATEDQLRAYRHESFWQCMDTLRDRTLLEELWRQGAPWVRGAQEPDAGR